MGGAYVNVPAIKRKLPRDVFTSSSIHHLVNIARSDATLLLITKHGKRLSPHYQLAVLIESHQNANFARQKMGVNDFHCSTCLLWLWIEYTNLSHEKITIESNFVLSKLGQSIRPLRKSLSGPLKYLMMVLYWDCKTCKPQTDTAMRFYC
jgi:hypothetical protein